MDSLFYLLVLGYAWLMVADGCALNILYSGLVFIVI